MESLRVGLPTLEGVVPPEEHQHHPAQPVELVALRAPQRDGARLHVEALPPEVRQPRSLIPPDHPPLRVEHRRDGGAAALDGGHDVGVAHGRELGRAARVETVHVVEVRALLVGQRLADLSARLADGGGAGGEPPPRQPGG